MCCVFGHLFYYWFVLSIYALTSMNSLYISPCLLLASLVIYFILIYSRMYFCFEKKGQTYSIRCWLSLFSLFSPCYRFLSRYVQIFSMVNVYIQPRHVHLHILKHIVRLMPMVLLLFVLIMSKANVFVKHANIFIHLNILLHN